MKILNIDPYCYSAKASQILESLGEIEEIDYSRKELLRRIESVDVLVLRFSHRIDREVIDNAPNLKVIASNVTGVDHIDVKYAEAKGVDVISLKGEYEFLRGIHATAELTWGLILSCSRNLPSALDSVKDMIWERDKFIGNDLYGRRLSIVGLGRIGEKIAGYGQAFGMSVVAFDTDVTKFDRCPMVQRTHSLEECIEMGDVVTVHVPLDDSTRHLIGEPQFNLMKRGALLINTSRGAIVNDKALLKCLENGKIGGAALDVLDGEIAEGFPLSNSLIEYAKVNSNLLITPHIGGVTHQSWEKTELFIAKKVAEKFAHYSASRSV